MGRDDDEQTPGPKRLILRYRGAFTEEISRSILSTAACRLEGCCENAQMRRRVFSVIVECLQNVVRHSEGSYGRHGHSPTFVVGRESGGYTIYSASPVSRTEVPALKSKLERINELDKEGLDDLYRHTIKGTSYSSKSGAGLGIVDMARRSRRKLLFEFRDISQDCCFFYLRINVCFPRSGTLSRIKTNPYGNFKSGKDREHPRRSA